MAWLSPVKDFLAAMQSGASAGEAIARIKSDNAQAAAKLGQAQLAENDQNALGYAKLASDERVAQQSSADRQASAAERLQQAMANQSALTDYRNRSLDEKSDALDRLLGYKQNALQTRSGLQQQGLDLKSSRYDTLASQFQQKLAQNDAHFQFQIGLKMSDADKAAYNASTAKQKVALKSLTELGDNPDSASHALAAKTLADEQGVIDRLTAKYNIGQTSTAPSTGIVTPSAADVLTTPASPSQNYNLFFPTTDAGATDQTSAADALTTSTANTLPAAAPTESATVTTQDQYDALPSGTVYTGRDGKQYRKP